MDLALAGRDLLMTPEPHPTDRLWLGFAVSSVVCLAVLAVSPIKDYFREYRGYQKQYRRRVLEVAGSSQELRQARAQEVAVRQLWIPELGNAVDRCVSCHLGVENPKMASAPQPRARFNNEATERELRPNSSSSRVTSVALPPVPPYSVGTASPLKPSAAIFGSSS